MSAIQADIEARLSEAEPEVEVLLAEVVGGSLVRLFIDHPGGVTLDLCERVTGHLATVRENYALEVSSPGIERPLSKPEHFRRFVGRRARVRTRGEHDGRMLLGRGEKLVYIRIRHSRPRCVVQHDVRRFGRNFFRRRSPLRR